MAARSSGPTATTLASCRDRIQADIRDGLRFGRDAIALRLLRVDRFCEWPAIVMAPELSDGDVAIVARGVLAASGAIVVAEMPGRGLLIKRLMKEGDRRVAACEQRNRVRC